MSIDYNGVCSEKLRIPLNIDSQAIFGRARPNNQPNKPINMKIKFATAEQFWIEHWFCIAAVVVGVGVGRSVSIKLLCFIFQTKKPRSSIDWMSQVNVVNWYLSWYTDDEWCSSFCLLFNKMVLLFSFKVSTIAFFHIFFTRRFFHILPCDSEVLKIFVPPSTRNMFFIIYNEHIEKILGFVFGHL